MGLEPVSSKKSKNNSDGKIEGNGANSSLLNSALHVGQSQLLETSHAYWSEPSTTQNDRKAYIDGLKASYQSLLDEFIASADACVDYTDYLDRVNKKWRWIVILGTGVVAIVNILAANFVTAGHDLALAANILSVTAAVAAAILAILANLENFIGAQRRAQGFRQARERFLDASREYEQLWNTYVNPFYPRAEACMNSIILIRMLVEKDRELRDRLVELTKTKGHET